MRPGVFWFEAKASRADFLSDARKSHRDGVGLGRWRYFICPEGLISPDELPEKWGLIYARPRKGASVVVGPFLSKNYHDQRRLLVEMSHESDRARERFILVKLLGRVGGVDNMNRRYKALYNENQLLKQMLHEARGTIVDLKRKALFPQLNKD